MALSRVTDGRIGPLQDGIDYATDGRLWRNRSISEIMEYVALMGLDFIFNATYYPEIDERALIFMIIEKLGSIYTIHDIIARGGFVEFAADLF